MLSFFVVLGVIQATLGDITQEYARGRALFEQGKLSEAEEVWRQLLKVAPQFETLWTNLGTTYEQQGKYEDAVAVYKKALGEFTTEQNLYSRLCEVRTRQYLDATIRGRQDQIRGITSNEAKEYCRIALERHPEQVSLWLTTGMLYTEILQPADAVPYLLEGIRRDPTNVKLHSTLGTTYSRLGKLNEAAEYAKKAIELDPTSSENWNSQAIARSVAFYEDAEAHASHVKATQIKAKDVKNDQCPQGYTAFFGWEPIPANLAKVVTAKKIEFSDGSKYDESTEPNNQLRFGVAEPFLPPSKYQYTDEVLFPNLEWTDRTVAIVTLQDVYLEGPTGIYYHDPSCTVFTGGHKGSSKVHSEFRSHGKVTKIPYPVASVLQQNPGLDSCYFINIFLGNYYHWMVEVFARFLYLHEHILTKPKYKDMKVVVPEQAANLVRGTIVDLMKFPESRLIWYNRNKGETERYHFSKVTIADWYWKPEHDLHPTDCSASYFPPKRILNKIRTTLGGPQQGVPRAPGDPIKVVYITREDATVRKVHSADERKLIMAMADFVGIENIEWGLLDGLSVSDQIALFKNATIIVAPHGAGMTNMLFAKPGTVVIQFPMNPNTDQCFGYLAQSLGFEYWMVPQISSYYYGVFPPVSSTALKAFRHIFQSIVEKIQK